MKNPKKKVGRPKIPKSRRRRHRLYLNLTDAELALVYGKAKDHGKPVMDYIRDLALTA